MGVYVQTPTLGSSQPPIAPALGFAGIYVHIAYMHTCTQLKSNNNKSLKTKLLRKITTFTLNPVNDHQKNLWLFQWKQCQIKPCWDSREQKWDQENLFRHKALQRPHAQEDSNIPHSSHLEKQQLNCLWRPSSVSYE